MGYIIVPTSSAKILFVEGKGAGSQSLSAAVQKTGYDVAVCHTGKEALVMLKGYKAALIVFDAASMRSNGSRSCRRLRREVGGGPIIHPRRRGQKEDLSAEADVYLEHPFTPRKLINRIRTLLPADDLREEVVRYGDIKLFPAKPAVDVAETGETRLTPKLVQLLQEFMRHPNEVVTRVQLMQHVWQTDYVGDTRTLDVHMRWVREIIEADPACPQKLKTVRGRGYILTKPGTEVKDATEKRSF
jgi:DNA-binding response OmpR family regulator